MRMLRVILPRLRVFVSREKLALDKPIFMNIIMLPLTAPLT